MKFFIILIFAVFILSTGLITVMYLGAPGVQDSTLTGENLTGTTLETGTNFTDTELTGESLDLTGGELTS